ncbi:cytochrome b/b6 domain-containing protein [Chachezhania sediminis]|uniref:cytochrome b/b6 domain-containing protein n=1 Tax=Chachezhania sediminis TaxID=2599291 RepID=UPI00131E3AA9|nr:cytochrome b/b6 domain-containing protein [Chachezhania sediminis]
MPLTNTATQWGSVTKILHWLTALLILTVLPLGLIAENLAEGIRAGTATQARVALTATLFSLHKTLGLTLFAVALFRIAWALTQTRPGLLNADHRVEAFMAEFIHFALYGALVITPLSGWITHAATQGFAPIWWPFGQNLPFVPKSDAVAHVAGAVHYVAQWTLIGALVLHVAGAIKHHVIDRDATLRRMWFAKSDAPQPPKADHTARPLAAAVVVWLAVVLGGAVLGLDLSQGPAQAAVAPSEEAPASQPAGADAWTVADGTLGIRIVQFGNTVDGSFATWRADIRFDENADPADMGQVDVVVDIASLTLGSVTQQAMGPDFFDATQFPQAHFAGTIEKTDTGYLASGPLTIRDQTVEVDLPFTLTPIEGQPDARQMEGRLEIQRLDFGVGQTMPDGSSLGLDVAIEVALTAVPAAQ